MSEMRILAVVSGTYGMRHVDNIRAHAPPGWQVVTWQAPAVFPPVIDDPQEFLPGELPPADLLLSFGEHKGVAELLPDLVRLAGVRAVIAAVDNETWLPRGLARQVRGWLQEMGVTCVTPKPLCSLTETHYRQSRRQRIAYRDPWIAEFARFFGQPDLRVTVDPRERRIVSVEVRRDAVCGCARHVAQGLIGLSVDDAEEQAGLLHHHYPCLASMGVDGDYGDTLMHVSGNVLKKAVSEQVRPFKRIRYLDPSRTAWPGSRSG